MSAFEDEFEIPAATEVDPAAEFLAKEQEELGDIGEDLGISASASSAAPDLTTNDDDENAPISASHFDLGGGADAGVIVTNEDVDPFFQESPAAPVTASMEGKDIYAGMQTLSVKDAMVKEEPEFLRQWKVEQEERLRKKDEEESAAKEELLKKAKQELEDWYKRYETQLEKTKSSNREEETKYEDATTGLNHIEPGSEWERVSKHCDFSAKAPGHSKDVSRMRSIMLQLKQNQTVQ